MRYLKFFLLIFFSFSTLVYSQAGLESHAKELPGNSRKGKVRYFNNTTLNLLMKPERYTSSLLTLDVNPGFHTVNGIEWNRRISVGIGTGIEAMTTGWDQRLQVPLFLDMRYSLKGNCLNPYLALNAGYSFTKNQKYSYDPLYLPAVEPYCGFGAGPCIDVGGCYGYAPTAGGYTGGVQLGVSKTLGKRLGYTLGTGYRFQQSRYPKHLREYYGAEHTNMFEMRIGVLFH